MYIGKLEVTKPTFTRQNSKLEFKPRWTENEVKTWKWSDLTDTVLDVNFSLTEPAFVSAVTINLTTEKVDKVEVLVDSQVCHTSKLTAFNGETVFPVNYEGTDVTIRIYAATKNISIGEIGALGMIDDEQPIVWPTPKKLEVGEGYVNIAKIETASQDADELAAADFLTDRLLETFNEPFFDNGVTVTFVKTDSREYEGERYTVDVTNEKITITAASRIALLYGADALMQTDSLEGFPVCAIDDKPSSKFRAFHLGLPGRDNMEFAKRLFTHVLIPNRYNAVIIEFAGGMKFDKHPKIAEGVIQAHRDCLAGKQPRMPHSTMVADADPLEKHEVKEFCEFVKSLGIAVIPEVQSLGHVQFLTYAYPEIAERANKEEQVDTRDADALPDEYYDHCYCPSNPRSYEIIFDLIDEIIEVTQPTYVHIGHDEIYHLGLCEKCREREIYQIYVDDVNKLYDYITKKGYRVMMWSDHLHALTKHTIPTAKAIDLIPKDIIMLDFTWYFHMEQDIETDLLEKGFKVGIGNLYTSHFPRPETRLNREGMIGGQFAHWVATSERPMADNGKLWDISAVGNMLWNCDSYDSRLASCYGMIITSAVQPLMRDRIRGTVSPYGFYDKTITIEGKPVPYELAKVCDAVQVDDFNISVNTLASTIVFNHATLYRRRIFPWRAFDTIGNYTITYSDGETVQIPIRYGAEIMCYKSSYPELRGDSMFRHQGYAGTWYTDPAIEAKTDDGSDICIRGFIWDNPNPEKKITTIAYTPADDDFSKLVIESINIVE